MDFVLRYFETYKADQEPDWLEYYHEMVRAYHETGSEDALWVSFQIFSVEIIPRELLREPALDWSLLEELALKDNYLAAALYLDLCANGFFNYNEDVTEERIARLDMLVRQHQHELHNHIFNNVIHYIMMFFNAIVEDLTQRHHEMPTDERVSLVEKAEILRKHGLSICKCCADRRFDVDSGVSPLSLYSDMSDLYTTASIHGVYYAYQSRNPALVSNELCRVLFQRDLKEIDPQLQTLMYTVGLYGEWPIQVAAMFGRFQAVKELIRLGAPTRVRLPRDATPLYKLALYGNHAFLANYLAPADCTDAQVLAARAHVRRCCDAARALMLVCHRQPWMDRFLVERIGRLVYATRYDAVWAQK